MTRIHATAHFDYPHVNDNKQCFLPGDTISGHLDLTVKHQLKLREAAISFEGRSKSAWSIGANPGYTHVGEDVLVDLQRDDKVTIGPLPRMLEPGLIYQWPFTFTLPLQTTYVRPDTSKWHQANESFHRKYLPFESIDPDYEDGPHPLPPTSRNIEYAVRFWYKKHYEYNIVLPVRVGQVPVEPSVQITEPGGLEMVELDLPGPHKSHLWRMKPVPPVFAVPAIRLHGRSPNDVLRPISLAVSADHGRNTTHLQSLTVLGVDLIVRHISMSRTMDSRSDVTRDYHGLDMTTARLFALRTNIKLPADGAPATVVRGLSFRDLVPTLLGEYTLKTYNRLDYYMLSVTVRTRDENTGRQSAFMTSLPWTLGPVFKNTNDNNGITSVHSQLPAHSTDIDSINCLIPKVTESRDEYDNDSIVLRRVYEVIGDDDIVEVQKSRVNRPSVRRKSR
jgi:hypothetical protein